MEPGTKKFSEIIKEDKAVLVDFFATWCGPCKLMQPVLQELKQKTGDSIVILKVDVDKNPETAAAYQIQGVPTLILFRKGQIKWRHSGVVPASQLAKIIQQFN